MIPAFSVNKVFWDNVGLARSKDLRHWEYYSRNPCYASYDYSEERYDNRWIGWPRMIVKDGLCHVFC